MDVDQHVVCSHYEIGQRSKIGEWHCCLGSSGNGIVVFVVLQNGIVVFVVLQNGIVVLQ